jgi:transcriptional regulator with XRE-family HTH domain
MTTDVLERLRESLSDRYRRASRAIAGIYPIRYIHVMNPVRDLRRRVHATQAFLAAKAGTSQPTVAAYEAGRKSPTLATVQRLADAVGLEASISFHAPMTREERRSLALHAAIARRLAEDPDTVRRKAKENLELMRGRHPGARQLLAEWSIALGRPLPALLDLLRSPDPWSRELRHVTPFAGVLSAAERAQVYCDFAADESEGA